MPVEIQAVSNPTAPVTCHAWNKDRTQVAISPNSHEVIVYKVSGNKLEELHRLTDHTQTVTAIDWAPNTDRIVTCAQDRNAYVWNFTAGKWEPSLVILRINRAATCVKWSPKEDKFAVGSGARIISVCYYEEDQNWWVSKHIKKPIKSTILSLDWHPNNVLLAAGSCDFKCRVYCAAVKGVDKKPEPTSWGASKKFGDLALEVAASPNGGGWVHDVSFSASGEQLVFVAHDACVYVIDSSVSTDVIRFKSKHLPYTSAQWIRPDAFVAAGHDYVPILYTFKGGAITELGEMDGREEKASSGSKFAALDKFRNMDSKGTVNAADVATDVKSTHQNAIGDLRLFAGDAGSASKLSTAGKDGKIVIWDMAEVVKMPGMSL